MSYDITTDQLCESLLKSGKMYPLYKSIFKTNYNKYKTGEISEKQMILYIKKEQERIDKQDKINEIEYNARQKRLDEKSQYYINKYKTKEKLEIAIKKERTSKYYDNDFTSVQADHDTPLIVMLHALRLLNIENNKNKEPHHVEIKNPPKPWMKGE